MILNLENVMDKTKKLFAYINAENEIKANIINKALEYEIKGADGLYIYNNSSIESDKEEFFLIVKELIRQIDIPVFVGCRVEVFDDGKHAYYTGATKVVVSEKSLDNAELIKNTISRFGKDKIFLEIDASKEDFVQRIAKLDKEFDANYLLKHVEINNAFTTWANETNKQIIVRDSLVRNSLISLLEFDCIQIIATNHFEDKDIIKAKNAMKEEGFLLNTFDSTLNFDEFKVNENGLIPVIVQDYQNDEVLMLAYMNKESFEMTIITGKMTYFSRSRNELWIKGETSGHYQYVKALKIDCDKDTILAKVKQVGAACHTGNRTCFFTNLQERTSKKERSIKILNDVYATILDRKNNPKEGSYTNYLFDKGLDKILKKCGEEACEITISAKNPESEEVKYEIADYLYHLMVLMVEKGIDWEDVAYELANRH